MLFLFNEYILKNILDYQIIDIILFLLIIFIIFSVIYFTIYFTHLNRYLIPTNEHNICEKLYRMHDNEKYYVFKKLLTKNNCYKIINEAEDYGKKNNWTKKRHEHYPTYDNQVTEEWKCYPFIKNICEKYMYKKISELYNINSYDIGINEIFVVKYDMIHQRRLDAHRDGSEFSFIIALNEDYSDGGTYFTNTKKHIEFETGDCLVFSGQNEHKGLEITSGTRYIIAGFLHFKSCDYCENKLYYNLNNNSKEEQDNSEQEQNKNDELHNNHNV